MDMVIGDANWSPGGPVYIIHCSCGRTFPWPFSGERVRCPRCGSATNLDTLRREWGEIPAEVMEGDYRDAVGALVDKLISKAKAYIAKKEKPPRWLLRRIKELIGAREGGIYGDYSSIGQGS